MVKQNRKKLSKRSRKTGNGYIKGRKTKMQYGGVSPLCNLGEPTSGSILLRNTDANVHNTNPQASLDLDSKFNQYGSPVPLGSWVVQGGANCSDEGVGTSNPKSETFKQYMENLSANYNLPQMGGSGFNTNENPQMPLLPPAPVAPPLLPPEPAPVEPVEPPQYDNYELPNNKNMMKEGEDINYIKQNYNNHLGGGFTTDPSEFIAGMPVYKAYDDCCPPAIIDGSLKFSSPNQPLCGIGAIKTGGSRKKRQNKGKSKGKSKRHGKKNSKYQSKKLQRGGDWTNSTSSKPAEYGTAFTGSPGVFEYPDDMSKRNFGCNQPSWGPECI